MIATFPCPAKLNLCLRILGRRPDGYHELQTAFQLLDYGDQLDIDINHSGDLQVTPNLLGVDLQDHLVFKAARLLQEVSGTSMGATLVLHKKMPMGGGIGGGSSNAATTLLALNRLWQLHLPTATLAELGRRLGADVPVFIHGQTAWAEGIGEQLTPIELPQHWYLVLAPNCHVPTREIFSHEGLTRNSKRITVRAFLKEGGNNDCQPLVERLYPEVKDAVYWLNRFGRAQMTGTGACVFAPFATEAQAQEVFAKRPANVTGFVARGIHTSPLLQRLQSL